MSAFLSPSFSSSFSYIRIITLSYCKGWNNISLYDYNHHWKPFYDLIKLNKGFYNMNSSLIFLFTSSFISLEISPNSPIIKLLSIVAILSKYMVELTFKPVAEKALWFLSIKAWWDSIGLGLIEEINATTTSFVF